MSVRKLVIPIIILSGLGLISILAGQPPVLAQDSECIKCHTDLDKLKNITVMLKPKGSDYGRGIKIEPLPRDQRVWVDPKLLEDENHGWMGCEECHGGDPTKPDFDGAHLGIKRDPSYPAPGVCDDCHSETEHYAKSLHTSLRGLKTPIYARADNDPAVLAEVNKAFAHCARCHGSCGQCHLSRPVHGGGGLIAGHLFKKKQPMDQTCRICHGTVFSEFEGGLASTQPDVHQEGGMECLDCHEKAQMHGDGKVYDSRYEVENGPACLDCHEEIFGDQGENKKTHDAHKDKVSCQVCHAQQYLNCASCHLTKDWGEDKYASWADFKIGLNHRQSEKRPERFVTVRHVPVHPDLFAPYVDKALTNFNVLPTWKMATPHNIRRQTQQNKDCNNCHGNWNVFLMRRDVEKDLIKANHSVMVPPAKVPTKIAPSE